MNIKLISDIREAIIAGGRPIINSQPLIEGMHLLRRTETASSCSVSVEAVFSGENAPTFVAHNFEKLEVYRSNVFSKLRDTVHILEARTAVVVFPEAPRENSADTILFKLC